MAKKREHKTWHTDTPLDGKVLVGCEGCRWRDEVNVSDLSWFDGMQAIFAVRDAHEANPAANTEAVAAAPAGESVPS